MECHLKEVKSILTNWKLNPIFLRSPTCTIGYQSLPTCIENEFRNDSRHRLAANTSLACHYFLFSVYYIRPLKMFLTKLTIRKGTCCAQKEVVTATPEISQHIYVTSIFGKKPCWCVSQEISKGESYKKWENWFNHWLLLVLEHPITRKISSNFVWGVDSC